MLSGFSLSGLLRKYSANRRVGAVVVVVVLSLVLGAAAGSLTPPGAPASTMHSLSEVYASIASAAFDSSAITANQNGSLIAQLKYLNNQLAWASSSTDIWNLNSGNVGIGTGSPNALLTLGIGDLNLASTGAALRIANVTILSAKGTDNIFVGSGSYPASLNGGFADTVIGEHAGEALISGSANVFIGNFAGTTATSSHHNVFVGYQAGRLNTSGTNNLFVGSQAGTNNTTGTSNVFLGGFNAGVNNTTGSSNTFVGWKAGAGNTEGHDNIAVGYQAGNGLGGDSTGNVLIGKFVGNSLLATSDHYNTWVGTEAGRDGSGQHSVFLGYSAGYSRLGGAANTGGFNTFLGSGATGNVANVTGAVAIGYGALVTSSHSAVFGSGLASGSLTDVYFGQGVATVSAAGVTLHATGGQGADNAGAPIRIAGGRGTGAGLGGAIIFQTTPASGSSSTLNTLADRMTIDSAGNVGIGTSSPITKLEVKGTASASHFLTAGGLQVAGTASASYSRFGVAATSHSLSSTQDILLSGLLEVDGQAYFDGSASVAGSFEVSGLIRASNGTAAAPGYTFENDPNTGLFGKAADILGISAGGTQTVLISGSGRVSVGSSSASALQASILDLYGSNALLPNVRITSTNTIVQPIIQLRNTGNTDAWEIRGTAVGGDVFSIGNTAGLADLYIDRNGRAGFGAVTAGSTFSVASASSSRLSIYSSGVASVSLQFKPNAASPQGIFTIQAGVNERLDFMNGSDAKLLTIASSGNIGVGAITPEQKFEVGGSILASGSGDIDLTLNSVSNADAKFTLRSAGASARLDILGSASQAFVSIASSGYVGVGTSGPTSLVHIAKNVQSYATDTSEAFRITAQTGRVLQVGYDNTIDAAYFTSAREAVGGRALILNPPYAGGAGGNVGINTVSVDAQFEVAGTASVSKVVTDLTASTNNFALCHETNGAGAAQEIKDCTGAPGADYMEMYPLSASVEEGEIIAPSATDWVVTMHGDRVPRIVQATAGERARIMGITSVAADAGDFNSIGYNIRAEDNPQPIALKGRVLVKVNLEGGPVDVGDPITISSVPGVGMRATTAGQIVGMALEPLTGPTSGSYQKIMVFVGPQYWAPSVAAAAGAGTPLADIGTSWLGWDFQNLFSSIVDAFRDLLGVTFESGGSIKAKQLCLDDVCVTKDQLKQLLNQQPVGSSPVPTPTPSVIEPSPTPTPSSEPTPSDLPASPTPTPSVIEFSPTPSSEPAPSDLPLSPTSST